tara:strand:- start:371 stop:652 length:282 start_codon:yes stop_codon:yes gene_type:complete
MKGNLNMKCEVEITNVWATFDIDVKDIISFNKHHNAPEDKLESFQFAFENGFNPFNYVDGNWDFSSASFENAHKNTSGKAWSESDKSFNTITE